MLCAVARGALWMERALHAGTDLAQMSEMGSNSRPATCSSLAACGTAG